MRIMSTSTSKVALILTAVFLSCCVGAAADDDPSISPSSTASPVLLSKGDKTPSEVPSMDPSASPSKDPSVVPSIDPSETPTMSPSESPSSGPSQSINPSDSPSPSFSLSPTTEAEKFRNRKTFNHTGTLQHYTIPKDDYYAFTAVGAKGGDCDGCDSATCKVHGSNWCYKCDAQFHEGGYGTLVRGMFYLHKGDQIEVVVGGRGGNCQAIRQQLPFVGDEQKKTPDGRDYLEALTGAGGGGASSVRVKYAADGKEDLLLIAGGGGGAAKFYRGEDGPVGPNGGWEWGGKNGQGGGLPNAGTFAALSGAGGGGVYGNGDPTRSSIDSSILAEGGKSLSDGGQGGFVDYTLNNSTLSGGAGGYGSGGQGGAGE